MGGGLGKLQDSKIVARGRLDCIIVSLQIVSFRGNYEVQGGRNNDVQVVVPNPPQAPGLPSTPKERFISAHGYPLPCLPPSPIMQIL